MIVEIVSSSVADARQAVAAGADRLELCIALETGGVTPSVGLVEEVSAAVSVPTVAMVRPRAGGFCYDRDELAVIARDAKRLLEAGAGGIVFAALLPDGRLNTEAIRRMVELAGEKETVFHRAYDTTPDPLEALDQLLACGVTRLLTSGQAPTALAGTGLLKTLRERAAGVIQLLPAGGVRAENAVAILTESGCDQLHLGPRRPLNDPTGGIYGTTTEVDPDAVRAIVQAVRGQLSPKISA